MNYMIGIDALESAHVLPHQIYRITNPAVDPCRYGAVIQYYRTSDAIVIRKLVSTLRESLRLPLLQAFLLTAREDGYSQIYTSETDPLFDLVGFSPFTGSIRKWSGQFLYEKGIPNV